MKKLVLLLSLTCSLSAFAGSIKHETCKLHIRDYVSTIPAFNNIVAKLQKKGFRVIEVDSAQEDRSSMTPFLENGDLVLETLTDGEPTIGFLRLEYADVQLSVLKLSSKENSKYEVLERVTGHWQSRIQHGQPLKYGVAARRALRALPRCIIEN